MAGNIELLSNTENFTIGTNSNLSEILANVVKIGTDTSNVTISIPQDISSSYNLILPSRKGISGESLVYGTDGQLKWDDTSVLKQVKSVYGTNLGTHYFNNGDAISYPSGYEAKITPLSSNSKIFVQFKINYKASLAAENQIDFYIRKSITGSISKTFVERLNGPFIAAGGFLGQYISNLVDESSSTDEITYQLGFKINGTIDISNTLGILGYDNSYNNTIVLQEFEGSGVYSTSVWNKGSDSIGLYYNDGTVHIGSTKSALDSQSTPGVALELSGNLVGTNATFSGEVNVDIINAREGYFSANTLYINNKPVLNEDSDGNRTVNTDVIVSDASNGLTIKAIANNGNIILDPTGTGSIKLNSDVQLTGGNITSEMFIGDLSGNVTGDVTGTVSSLENHTTDTLSEGSTNLYFTSERVRSNISGGSGINYDSSTGVFSLPQDVSSTSNVVFNNVTAQMFIGDLSGNIIGTVNDDILYIKQQITILDNKISDNVTSDTINTSNVTISNELNVEGNIILYSDNGNNVTFSLSSNLSSSYNLILPSRQGISGEVLVYSNDGQLSWDEFKSKQETSVYISGNNNEVSLNGYDLDNLYSWIKMRLEKLSIGAPHLEFITNTDNDINNVSLLINGNGIEINTINNENILLGNINGINSGLKSNKDFYLDASNSIVFSINDNNLINIYGNNNIDINSNVKIQSVYINDSSIIGDLIGNVTGTVSSLSNLHTDHLSEGSQNKYYSDNLVDTHLSGGTGVTYSNGSIAIGQSVGISDNVTFNNVTVNGTLSSDDITGSNVTVSNDLVVSGNLTVNGTQTIVNATTLDIGDNKIVVNAGGSIIDAGIIANVSGTEHEFVYSTNNNAWGTTGDLNIGGNVIGTTFIGDGSQLTGISAGANLTDYSDASFNNININGKLTFNTYNLTKLGENIYGENNDDWSGTSLSLSSDGKILAIGAPYNDNGTYSNQGHARVYKYEDYSWVQMGNDIDGESHNEFLGANTSVSLSGNGLRIAVGSYYANSRKGETRVFEYDIINNSWSKLGNTIVGEYDSDQSGLTISLSKDGTRLAIGSSSNDDNGNNAGHVRIFQYVSNSNLWVQLGADIDGYSSEEVSGTSVSLSSDGSIVAIGASGKHIARVFEYNGLSWSQLGTDIIGLETDHDLGGSISLSSDGTILAIGAKDAYVNNIGNAGVVKIFKYNNTSSSWSQLGGDIKGVETNNQYGYSVSLSGDGNTVVIGAINNNNNGVNSGYVEIFKYVSSEWKQVVNTIYGKAELDEFGSAVCISENGSIVAIGAPKNDDLGTNKGTVEVYEILQSSNIEIINGNISGVNTITATRFFGDGSQLTGKVNTPTTSVTENVTNFVLTSANETGTETNWVAPVGFTPYALFIKQENNQTEITGNSTALTGLTPVPFSGYTDYTSHFSSNKWTPQIPGLYLHYSHVCIASSTSDALRGAYTNLRKSGTEIHRSYAMVGNDGDDFEKVSLTMSQIINVTQSDIDAGAYYDITMYVVLSSGTAFTQADDGRDTYITIHRIA